MRLATLRVRLNEWRGAAGLARQIARVARTAFAAGLHVPPAPRDEP